MTPPIGSPAPDFALKSTSGAVTTLAEYRGQANVLIAFFPLAFTSTCTAELCSFTDDYSQFEAAGVAVLPISVDADPSLREYKAKHAIGVDLLSDFKREASRAYGVLNEERFFANRSYFLVDKGGIVRWSHVESMNGNRRDNAELLDAIKALRD